MAVCSREWVVSMTRITYGQMAHTRQSMSWKPKSVTKSTRGNLEGWLEG